MLSGGGHLGFHNVFRAAVSCGIIRSAGCLQWTKGMDVVGRARPCLRQMPTGTSPRLCQGCVHVRACRAHSVRSGSFVEVAEHVRPQSSRQHRSLNGPPLSGPPSVRHNPQQVRYVSYAIPKLDPWPSLASMFSCEQVWEHSERPVNPDET